MVYWLEEELLVPPAAASCVVGRAVAGSPNLESADPRLHTMNVSG